MSATVRRFAAVLAGGLLAAGAQAGCSKAPEANGTTPPPTTTATQSVSVQDHSDARRPRVPAIAKANDLVDRFAETWVRKDLTDDQWLTEISPLCERGLALRLRKSNRANSPEMKITGEPKLVVPPSPAPGKPGPEFGVSAVYHVSVTGGTLVVTIEAVGDGWLVFAVDFERRVTTS